MDPLSKLEYNSIHLWNIQFYYIERCYVSGHIKKAEILKLTLRKRIFIVRTKKEGEKYQQRNSDLVGLSETLGNHLKRIFSFSEIILLKKWTFFSKHKINLVILRFGNGIAEISFIKELGYNK